jgi:hypothetical protein
MAHTDFADCLPTSAANSLSDKNQIVTARHFWLVAHFEFPLWAGNGRELPAPDLVNWQEEF